MVVADLEQPLLVVGEAVLVRGEGFVSVVVGEALERAEEVAERIVLRLRVVGDVRGDARQYAVAGEQHAVAGLPEAQMTRE